MLNTCGVFLLGLLHSLLVRRLLVDGLGSVGRLVALALLLQAPVDQGVQGIANADETAERILVG